MQLIIRQVALGFQAIVYLLFEFEMYCMIVRECRNGSPYYLFVIRKDISE